MDGETEPTRGVETLLGDPKRAIVRLAVPMVVAMSAQTIYNLADAIWVSGCGPRALSAVGFYFPFFILGLAVAVGVGVGTGSAIARRIGAKDKPGVDAVASHGMVILAIAAVSYVAPTVFFTRPLMGTIGAGEAIDDAVAYGRIMFAGTPLFFFNGFGGAVLRSEGDARRAMIAMLAGAGLNILLDPLFIYGFGLGVVGAAWASITAMACVSLVMARWLFLERNTYVTFRFRGFRFRRDIVFDIARVGGPAAFSHASMFVMAFAITSIVAKVGGTDGVAVYTTGWRVVMFAILPMLGIASSVTPVTGAAFGAGDAAKLRIAYFPRDQDRRGGRDRAGPDHSRRRAVDRARVHVVGGGGAAPSRHRRLPAPHLDALPGGGVRDGLGRDVPGRGARRDLPRADPDPDRRLQRAAGLALRHRARARADRGLDRDGRRGRGLRTAGVRVGLAVPAALRGAGCRGCGGRGELSRSRPADHFRGFHRPPRFATVSSVGRGWWGPTERGCR
jgi:putative MATE family efflux protein